MTSYLHLSLCLYLYLLESNRILSRVEPRSILAEPNRTENGSAPKWPNRDLPRFSRHQNGRTEILPRTQNALPNRTEPRLPRFATRRWGGGGGHPITKVHSTLYPTRAELHIFEGVRVAMLPFIMAHKKAFFLFRRFVEKVLIFRTIKADIFLLDHAGHSNPVFAPRMILAEPNRTEIFSA